MGGFKPFSETSGAPSLGQWVAWEQVAYGDDQRNAASIGRPSLTALVNQLRSLSDKARINVIAHSIAAAMSVQAGFLPLTRN